MKQGPNVCGNCGRDDLPEDEYHGRDVTLCTRCFDEQFPKGRRLKTMNEIFGPGGTGLSIEFIGT